MDKLTLSPDLMPAAVPPRPKSIDPAKIRDAAQQFESLLLAQLLQSSHPSGGWLGGGDDSASGTAFSFAEQELATSMAQHGGIGLAKLIASALEKP
jgi:Rod binding domain-containing protein